MEEKEFIQSDTSVAEEEILEEETLVADENELWKIYAEASESFLGVIPGEERSYRPKDFAFFRECMEKKTILNNMVFTMFDPKGGLTRYEGPILIKMPATETVDANDTVSSEIFVTRAHLNRSYSVVVYSVNESENTVLVSFVRAKNILRPSKLKEIRAALERGDEPTVKARVYKLSEASPSEMPQARNAGRIRMAYLDICGLGIYGRLHEKDFGDFYVPDMRFFIDVGDVVSVKIYKEGVWLKNGKKKPRFECSKKDIGQSAWDYIQLKKGMEIRVECITPGHGRVGGDIVRGSALLADGNRNVVCHYVAKRTIRMEVGKTYIAKITKFSREHKKLNADIIEPCGREF